MAQLLEAYPEDLRVVYRHYPLITIHDKAFLAAAASEAAGLQGKFFEMKALLFETSTEEWSGLTPEAFETWLVQAATRIDLDVAKFTTDLKSEVVTAKVQSAYDSASSIGIPGTPFVLLNGQPYQAPRDFTNLSTVIKLVVLEKKQFESCPPDVIDESAKYSVVLTTTKGEIVIELYPEMAPMTVNSFVYLALNGWFDNNPFYRVLEGKLAQTGDPTGTGYGSPGYIYGTEISELTFDKAGVVGMASSGPDTNGSQFFITMDAIPTLNGNYTIFGQVVQGLDVVEALTVRDPSQGEPLPEPDSILKVSIIKE